MGAPWLTIIDAIGTLPRMVESVAWNVTHYRRGKKALGREIKIARTEDDTMTGEDACKHLNRFGIFTGVTHTQTDAYCFTVKTSQYAWALALLQGAGYEVVSGTHGVTQTKPSYAWGDADAPAPAGKPAKRTRRRQPKRQQPGAVKQLLRRIW